jgi:hypothetical protein
MRDPGRSYTEIAPYQNADKTPLGTEAINSTRRLLSSASEVVSSSPVESHVYRITELRGCLGLGNFSCDSCYLCPNILGKASVRSHRVNVNVELVQPCFF